MGALVEWLWHPASFVENIAAAALLLLMAVGAVGWLFGSAALRRCLLVLATLVMVLGTCLWLFRERGLATVAQRRINEAAARVEDGVARSQRAVKRDLAKARGLMRQEKTLRKRIEAVRSAVRGDMRTTGEDARQEDEASHAVQRDAVELQESLQP